jgi:hypothetical protein
MGIDQFIHDLEALKRSVSEEEKSIAVKEAFVEMQENGIVAVGDIMNTPLSLEAKKNTAIQCSNFIEVYGSQAKDTERNWNHALGLAAAVEGIKNIIPHAPYSLSRTLFQRIRDYQKPNTTLSMHHMESEGEAEYFVSGNGPLAERFKSWGLERPPYIPTSKRPLASLGEFLQPAERVLLRPETAQGIFVNFMNVQGTSRQKLPFGIAQLGKAFRNEITTGNFLFRTREFEQMELEFFIHPGENEKWLDYWCEERLNWFKKLGINPEKLRLRPHDKDELAHYSTACFDVEYEFPFGWSELEGIADRGTFDLDQHNEYSGKKQQYFDPQTNERIIPAVVESSAGVDRTFLTCLVDAYCEEEVRDEKRIVLKLDPKIAPITCAVFPLVKKDGLPEIAQKIVEDIRTKYSAFFDQGGSIGRRYRRQDEAGTPYGVTIDHQTTEDGTVTLRDRDTMDQVRISTDNILSELQSRIQ